MANQWAVSTLRRIVSDLVPFQQGDIIPQDVAESFSVSLELVYRELLAKESLEGMTVPESEACECVRQSLALLANLTELSRVNERQFTQTEPIRDGQIGRPKFCISCDQLSMLLEHQFSVPQISELLGVSVSTVRRRMAEYNLSVSATYASITSNELDSLVREIQTQFPMCGNRQMQGHLLARGYRIQQHRIRKAQRRVDPQGSVLRRLNAIRRRVYSVPAPLSLWHIDGNHKLIR